MIAALIEAADRGVDVKILVDGFSALQQMDGNTYFRAVHHGKGGDQDLQRINLLMP